MPWSPWTTLGGGFLGGPAVARQASGLMVVLGQGGDGRVWMNWQVNADGAWSGWASTGGTPVASAPSCCLNDGGGLVFFYRRSDNQLWHRWQDRPGAGWSNEESLGGNPVGRPAAVLQTGGRLVVFVRSSDGQIHHRWQMTRNGDWSDWEALGGGPGASDPSASLNGAGGLVVFVRRSDGQLWHRWQHQPDGAWSQWDSLGGELRSGPAATLRSDRRLSVCARGPGNRMITTRQTAPGGSWIDWETLMGPGNCPSRLAPTPSLLAGDPGMAVDSLGRQVIVSWGVDAAYWRKQDNHQQPYHPVPLVSAAAGEFVPDKFLWLMDKAEVVGTVVTIGCPRNESLDPAEGHGDDIDIAPDPSYSHLIAGMRGNNPLPWDPTGTQPALHCETYPLTSAEIGRLGTWTLAKKPFAEPFMVQIRSNNTSRPLKLGDRVRLTGWWVIDHHPEFYRTPTDIFDEPGRLLELVTGVPPRYLRVGQSHIEFHPFDWKNIELVEPLRAGGTATGTLSLAAPLHEQQFVGTLKWLANAEYGGKVYLEPSGNPAVPYRNMHTRVSARLDLPAPPKPTYPAALLHREKEIRRDSRIPASAIRTIETRQRTNPGLTVRATIDAARASIMDPARDRSVFQATYKLTWEPVQADWRWCNRCQSLFYGGGQATSRCPATGTHAAQAASGSGNYSLFHNASAGGPVQGDWRWCNKCQSLFYGAGWAASHCPAGATHARPRVSGSGNYTLMHGAGASPDLQDNWRWCNKCQTLFYGGGQESSRCPTGGTHEQPSVSGSANYSLLHMREGPRRQPPARAKP